MLHTSVRVLLCALLDSDMKKRPVKLPIRPRASAKPPSAQHLYRVNAERSFSTGS